MDIKLESLPVEVLLLIFSFLDPKSLCQLQCVCKLFRQIAGSDSLWRPLVILNSGDKNKPNTGESWKDRFRKRNHPSFCFFRELFQGFPETAYQTARKSGFKCTIDLPVKKWIQRAIASQDGSLKAYKKHSL